MQLFVEINHILGQLSSTIAHLNSRLFMQPCQHLSNATIGQHTRHVIEMWQCLLYGYDNGIVNYENRARDKRIESDPVYCRQLLQHLQNELNKANKPLLLESALQGECNDNISLDTNYYREIAYNMEHAVHHMALIKVGLLEISNIELPAEFGVAQSTLKYSKECVR